MESVYSLGALNEDCVCMITQHYITADGQRYQVGENARTAYQNSPNSRANLLEVLPEPYKSAVLAVWGNTTTLKD